MYRQQHPTRQHPQPPTPARPTQGPAAGEKISLNPVQRAVLLGVLRKPDGVAVQKVPKDGSAYPALVGLGLLDERPGLLCGKVYTVPDRKVGLATKLVKAR